MVLKDAGIKNNFSWVIKMGSMAEPKLFQIDSKPPPRSPPAIFLLPSAPTCRLVHSRVFLRLQDPLHTFHPGDICEILILIIIIIIIIIMVIIIIK